jgi:hypothetical protein
MVALDTSGSMNGTAAANSCKTTEGFPSNYPDTRIGAARCALTKIVQTWDGVVNFGLATFAYEIEGNGLNPCPANMSSTANGCSFVNYPDNIGQPGCGPQNGNLLPGTATEAHRRRRGGSILVPLQVDADPSPPSNAPEMLVWADNRCNDQCMELHAFSNIYTPLNGILRDMYRYLSRGWNKPPKPATDTPYDHPTPLSGSELSCRSVNVILVTDGAETCDTAAAAVDAAAQLWSGFDITTGGETLHWKVKVHVIDVANATPSVANANIANAGNGFARSAISEQALFSAIGDIVNDALATGNCGG